MAKHRLKWKKVDKGKQVPADGFLWVPEGYTPVSHDAEARAHVSCGKCGHSWDWHNRMRFQRGKWVYRACTGAYLIGLEVSPCKCSLTWDQTRAGGTLPPDSVTTITYQNGMG